MSAEIWIAVGSLSNLFVGIGTLIVASKTGSVSSATGDLVKVTGELVESAKQAMALDRDALEVARLSAAAAREQAQWTSMLFEASSRPVLVPLGRLRVSKGATVSAELVVMNAGNGVCQIDLLNSSPELIVKLGSEIFVLGATETTVVLPAGESVTIIFRQRTGDIGALGSAAALPSGAQPSARLEMSYTDSTMRPEWRVDWVWTEGGAPDGRGGTANYEMPFARNLVPSNTRFASGIG